MHWSCDRTGFPVLALPAARLAVHLLPVARRQFERFLAEPCPYGDAWYEALLTVSPRLTTNEATPTAYEMLFVTGLFPPEAQEFARWLGDGFEVPKANDWREAYRALLGQPLEDGEIAALEADSNLHPAARGLIGWLARTLKPKTWAQLALMRGGLLEWVRMGHGTFGGYGVPRTEFQNVIINPDRDHPVRPVYESRRYRYFGVRLVRPLEPAS